MIEAQLLHIFRNTPLGRETLFQSAYFCKQINSVPVIYIPKETKFLFYFDNDVVQVDLDESYLTAPETAAAHATEIVTSMGLEANFLKPKDYTASSLPDIPSNFDFMCCPRSISDLSSKIGLGYIGPRVRRIVSSAQFPVLLTSAVFKPWNSIAVFFGGSSNAFKALKLGLRVRRISGKPLQIFTKVNQASIEEYRNTMREAAIDDLTDADLASWHFFESGALEENLYDVPHDALVVMGAFGHGLVRDLVFGSMMERIQSIVPNNLLIVGPKYASTT